jgi:pimeloyl-ACP methyl ester carboxylesterase
MRLFRPSRLIGVLALLAVPAMAEDLAGQFDVGGHTLFARCTGQGGPTIVYLHGDHGTADSAMDLPWLLSKTHRFCVYSRANNGKSGTVAKPVTGEMIVADLHKLLAALHEPPPYVLLGASLGGLVAYQYLMTYPDDVTAMLLLDAAFPDELGLEPLWPADQRLTHDDWKDSPEGLDYLGLYESVAALRGHEPKIPVTYLEADPPTTWRGISPEYDAKIQSVIENYVADFSPGVLKSVRSEHWMENGNPEAVAREMDLLIASLPGR